MSLFDALSQISEQVKQHRELMNKSEATVEQVSVLPFIDALGYDTQSPAEVRKQYAILNWDAVDYAILRNNEPIMVVEAKKASENLTKHWKQLFQYFNAEDVRFGILTNGIKYRFYTDLKKSHIMDKEPFLTIDMLDLEERLVDELEGFTKNGFDPQRILDGAQKRRIMSLLAQELKQPSDGFVRYFAKQVHSGRLTEADVQRYGRLLQDAWRELSKQVHAKRGELTPEKTGCADDNGSELTEKLPVFAVYQGRRFEATLMIDDRMWLQRADNMLFDGRPMNHAVAAIEAVKKVDPLTKKSPVGWIFWRFIDSDTGEERPIKEIFEEVWTRNSSNGY